MLLVELLAGKARGGMQFVRSALHRLWMPEELLDVEELLVTSLSFLSLITQSALFCQRHRFCDARTGGNNDPTGGAAGGAVHVSTSVN